MEQTGQALPATIQRIWRASAALWALSAHDHRFGTHCRLVFLALVLLVWVGSYWHCDYSTAVPISTCAVSLSFLALQHHANRGFLAKGFFFRKNEAIPISRIQNVTLEAGPLLQWQTLQQVNIETASTAHVIDDQWPTNCAIKSSN